MELEDEGAVSDEVAVKIDEECVCLTTWCKRSGGRTLVPTYNHYRETCCSLEDRRFCQEAVAGPRTAESNTPIAVTYLISGEDKIVSPRDFLLRYRIKSSDTAFPVRDENRVKFAVDCPQFLLYMRAERLACHHRKGSVENPPRGQR